MVKWSYSAHQARRTCQRRFAFAHIMASHNAKDAERREAYIRKQLQHVTAWQGSVVHHVLATDFAAALEARVPFNWSALTERAHALARQQFAFSAAGRYREAGLTKTAAGDSYCALYEHEHKLDLPVDTLASVEEMIAGCFRVLAEQTEFLALLRRGTRYSAEQHLNIEISGVTVAVTPDLIITRGGKPMIVDWKTGNSDTSDYRRQMLIYALAVARDRRWPVVAADEIVLYEANLSKGAIRQHPVDDVLLAQTEDFIYQSVLEQQALVGSGRYADLDLESLDVADQPTTCSHCNFRPVCLARLEADAQVPLDATASVAAGIGGGRA